ncbi:Uncharacterised protein [Bordetella pertussis]|nr:Uncharacterised protein [Bordetella pertussis]
MLMISRGAKARCPARIGSMAASYCPTQASAN